MKTIRRMTGALMIFAALISLLVSIYFIFQIWRLRQPVTDGLVSNLSLLYDTTLTSEIGLMVIDATVLNISETITTLEDSTVSLAQTIHDTGLLADSFSTLMGEDFPTIITNTQSALDSAQSSAVVIDNVLNSLAAIPLIGIDYDPEVPLSQALGQVSLSLSPLPTQFIGIQGDLNSTHTDLLAAEESIIVISQNLQVINTNLGATQTVIDQYQEEVSTLKTRLKDSRTSAPDWVRDGAWILTFIIVWLVINQIGMLVEGIDMFSKQSTSTNNT